MLDREQSEPLETEWEAVRDTEGDEHVVSVDCSARPKLCAELGVWSFPAIRLYHQDGRQDRYRGPRKAAPIVSFLRRALRPAVSYVATKNATSFVSIDDVVFIGHLAPRDISLRNQLQAAAQKYRDRFSFALSSDVQQQSAVTCSNNLDDVQHSTTELSSPTSLEEFIRMCSTPLIPELTRRSEMSLYQTGKSLVHYFVRGDRERDEYVAEMRPLAKKYQEYLHFTTTDVNEYPDAVEMMGFMRGACKVLSVQNPNNGDVFPYTGGQQLTAGVVEAFLGDIIQGNVKPWTWAAATDRHSEL
ncbi:hypothetical protein B0T22DRAFT_375806 [Podospora appendiculata]|uniref:Protein disulfide-isomerase n=1 Tax=Podospora appendiculata TaxID=314037 RepID=A0AAE0XAK8_9PEZI|nr:hypothetical protein B0T22DRAFT_375806 [Podospora appendiculata]